MKVTRKNAKNLLSGEGNDVNISSAGIEEFFQTDSKTGPKVGGGATPSVNNTTTNVNFF